MPRAFSFPMIYTIYPFIMIGAVASCYRVTGGQLNPIITLAHLFRKDKPEGFDYIVGGIYMLAQAVGCGVGIPLVWWFTREIGVDIKPVRRTNGDYQVSEAIGYEIFGSFLVVLAYLMVSSKVTSPTKDSGSQAMLIGTSSSAIMYTTYSVTGGGLDPFYVFSHACWRAIDHDTDTSFDYIYIYLLFPPLGALIALAVHRFILLPGTEKSYRDIEQDGQVVEANKV